MTALLNYLFEASVILGLSGIGYFLLLSREPMFQFRRIYVLTGTFAGLAIPLVSSDVMGTMAHATGISIDKVVVLPPLLIEATQQAGMSNTFKPDIFEITVGLYMLGALMVFAFFVQRLWAVNRIIRSCDKINMSVGPKTLRSTSKYPTFSFFNALVVNENDSLSELERQQVIEHEKVHISQGHSYDLMLLEALTIILWFHPLSWIFKRSQKENHEYIADRQVINRGFGEGYRALLAKMTLEGGTGLSLIGHHFSKVLIIKRLETIKDNNTKGAPWKVLLSGSLLFGLFLFFSCNQDMIQETRTLGENLAVPDVVQAKLGSLKAKYSSIDFYYAESDLTTREDFELKDLDSRFIQYSHPFPDRKKVGLIIVPEDQKALFLKLSDYEEVNGIYNNVQEAPRPSEGLKEFYEYIGKNLVYPLEARRKGIEGKVLIEFIVDESGALTQVKAVKGIGHGCDKAALDIMQKASPWVAGKVDGKAVKVRMILPITFKLPT